MADNSTPAFPSNGTMGEICQEGMTLRQYYAAKAMQGMMVSGWMPSQFADWSRSRHEMIAEEAFKIADAMIAAEAA